jgi:hypothetical protein
MTSLLAHWHLRRDATGAGSTWSPPETNAGSTWSLPDPCFPAGFDCDIGRLCDVALNGFLDLVFGDRADNLLGNLAALEDEQRRDAANVEIARGIGVFIDV